MNRRRFIAIGVVAMALGAIIAAGVCCVFYPWARRSEISQVNVVLVTRDIGPEERIAERDITTVKVPANVFKLGCFNDMLLLVGQRVILPILKGEQVCQSQLSSIREGDFRLPDLRAVRLPVNGILGSARFVEPGMHVDVLLSRRSYGGSEHIEAVLKNVYVIAAGELPEKNSALQPIPAVSLLLSPNGAQKLAQARRRGKIHLVRSF
jgi:Flp pilus assembly protein CpaB